MAKLFQPKFELTEKQAEAWEALTNNIYRNIWFGGWAGWGKSFVWVMWLWYMAQRYPWTRWFIWRRELSNLMKTTINTYYKMWQVYEIPKQFMWKLDKKYNIIRFENWSEILLLDCATQPADPLFTRFWSLELTWGFIDEANEIDEQAVTILKTRIARQKNKEYWLLPKLLCTFNPDQWRVKRTFYTPRKSGTLPEDTTFIPSLATDNDYIDPEYITQLRNSTDEVTKQRLLYWNFDWSWDAGKLFRHDEIEDLFETNVDKKSDVTYLSVDVARLGDDKTVICIWKGLECIKIIHYDRNTIDEIAARVKDLEYMYWVSRRNIVVDSDWVWCLVKWTEVFTTNWWKKVEDLELWDKLYTQDNEWNVVEATLHSILTHPNTQVIELDNGYKFSRWHFMPVKTRKEYPYKLKSRDDIAWVYKSDKRRQYILKNDFKWAWKDYTFKSENTKMAMPNWWEMEINNGRTISWVHLARLLWWFVSEWYLDWRYFCLCQSVNSIYNDDIEKCIKDCWLIATKVQKDDEYLRKIGNKPLLEFIKRECYTCEDHIACNKKVPEFIKQWTPEIIKNFLETYNFWDGYIHKWTWMMYYATSSVQLREDLLELIYKKGWYGSYTLHSKAWSEFEIEWRTTKRTKDVRTVYEYKHNSICITPKIQDIHDDTVYDLRISWDSKLFMCRFADHRAFWVHNWGLADLLRGCTNFVNNSRPYKFEAEKKWFVLRNYANLKAQCYFKLKEMMEKRLIRVYADWVIRDKLSEELENIFISGIDTDWKVKIEDKKDLKRRINRSPDFADAIMFRMIYLVQETEANSEIITWTYEIDYDDLLY